MYLYSLDYKNLKSLSKADKLLIYHYHIVKWLFPQFLILFSSVKILLQYNNSRYIISINLFQK